MNADEIYEAISVLTLGEKIVIYKRLKEELEDDELLREAKHRVRDAKDNSIPEIEVFKICGITQEHLNDIEVKLE